MTNIIVDTSVAVKWYSEENESDLPRARAIKNSIVAGELSLICPEIVVLELINVLQFSKKLPQEESIRSVHSMIDLCDEVVPLVDVDEIITVAYQFNLASYDAAFIALAIKKNIPLVTADYAHHKKSISPHVVWLSEWK